VAAGNAFLALRGNRFRAFVHPVGAILAALEAAGLTVVSDRSGAIWRTVVAVRDGADA
jgi:hypothetical protein